MGCSKNTYIDVNGLRTSHPIHFPELQHSKQPCLNTQRKLSYLIKKKRTIVCTLESARMVRMGAAECSFLVSEKFAVHKRFRNRTTIYLDVRGKTADRLFLKGIGNDFLTDSRFSKQQYRTVQRRNLPYLAHHGSQSRKTGQIQLISIGGPSQYAV